MLNDPQTDEFAGGRWLDDDAAVRTQAVHELGKAGKQSQHILVEIALGDAEQSVRCAAISYLTDLPTVQTLIQQHGDTQDAASLQLHKLLAGSIESELSETSRLELIQTLDSRSLKQVALLAKDKPASNAAISHITDSQDLADICLFAASVHTRKLAAEKISDSSIVTELLEKLAGKDKTVSKMLSDKLPQSATAKTGSPTEKSASATSQEKTDVEEKILITSISTEASSPDITSSEIPLKDSETASFVEAELPLEPQYQPYLDLVNSLTEPLSNDAIALVQEYRGKLANELAGVDIATLPSALADLHQSFAALMDAVANTDDSAEQIAAMEIELNKLSPKHTSRINKLGNDLRQLAHSIGWPKTRPANAPFLHLKDLLVQISALTTRNQAQQQQVFDSCQVLLEAMKKALEDGHSTEAIQAWDRILSQLINLGGKLNKSLKKQIADYRVKIKELKDWKNFAATEKKKHLIQQMQHLQESKMHAADKSRLINAAHQEWKSLGRSSQNEKLWREFKTLSDQAYEPCKEHFKQQKLAMQNNFQQRMEICTQLEQFLLAPDRSALNIPGLNQLESKAKEDWDKFAPVEQTKIKKLQKRFYGVMDELRALRHTAFSVNAQSKQSLVQRAQQLAQLEDNVQAIKEAKSLQTEWKTLGPTSFKDDRKYWEEFRKACDEIFQKRDAVKKESLDTSAKSSAEASNILKSMDELFALDDDSFRDARNNFAALQRNFREALGSQAKAQRKTLLDQFNDSVRKIEARLKRLPDKKLLLAKNTLSQKFSFCEHLEDKLQQCNDDQSLRNLIAEIDTSAWDALENSNPTYDKMMSERFIALRTITSSENLSKALKIGEQRARIMCIELEIRASVDSPLEDQSLRMKTQLETLQNNFNKRSTVISDNGKFAYGMEMQFLCLGPLSKDIRQTYGHRIRNGVNKLLGIQ